MKRAALVLLVVPLITLSLAACDKAESPLDAEARDASFQPFSPPGDMGGEGQGASFEVYPYNGIGISAPPDRPGAVYFDNCQADWFSADKIPGFVLERPDGSWQLEAGIDLDVEVRLLYSIGTDWEEWLGTGRLQTIRSGKASIVNITGVVSFGGETRRVSCMYRSTANRDAWANIRLF